MKYTKAQRHRIYVNALERLPEEHWLCWALSKNDHLADLSDFPEVLKQKPKRYYLNLADGTIYWFPLNEVGMKKRTAILRKAIKATE